MKIQIKKYGVVVLYIRILGVLLSVIGAVSIILLQLGWLTLNVSPYPWERVEGPAISAPILKVTGKKEYLSDFIPVDPSRAYRLSGLFRASSDNVGREAISSVYFGVRVYDRDRHPISDAPDLYPAANGVTLTGLEGWVRLQGDIPDISEEDHDGFRPGTAWIRIVVIVPSDGASDAVMEVAEVEFTEKIDLQPSRPGVASD